MEQKDDAYEGNDDTFFEQLLAQVIDRSLDQSGPVVDGHDLDAFGKTGLQLLKLGLYTMDRVEGVLAEAHHDHTRGHVPLPVEVGQSTA